MKCSSKNNGLINLQPKSLYIYRLAINGNTEGRGDGGGNQNLEVSLNHLRSFFFFCLPLDAVLSVFFKCKKTPFSMTCRELLPVSTLKQTKKKQNIREGA